MGPRLVTRCAAVLPLAAAGLLLAGAPARASDVIALQKPSNGAHFRLGAAPVFRFTALVQSSTALPKIQVSTTGRTNADGSFVQSDVIETTTAQRVAGQQNTFQVTSRERWTRTAGTYYWNAVTFYCADAYNCVNNSPVRQLTVQRLVLPVLFHSVTVKRVRQSYVAWVWLGVKSTVAGELVRELTGGKEHLVHVVKRRTMLAGRRPIRLGTLRPGRYALYLTARSGSRHKEIRRIVVVRG